MKIDSSLILKPGAILKADKIDFNDPEVKELLRIHFIELRKLRRINTVRWEPKR